MKTVPLVKMCNYARHNANDPFVKSETGKYFLDSKDKVVIIHNAEAYSDSLKELIALSCLACGDRWYIKVKD